MKRSTNTILSVSVLLVLAGATAWLLSLPQARAVLASALVGRWVTASPDCVITPGRQFSINYHGMTYFGDTSSLTDIYLLCYGAWEPTELAFLKHAAEVAGGSDAIFVDIGANTGLHTLYMSKHAGTVHAFEPYPPVLERLHRSIEASNLTNAVVHEVGLGERDAELPFEEPAGGNVGAGSFVLSGTDGKDSKLTLRIVEGDSYFAQHGITRVNVVKADIEGYEKLAFTGLRETLQENRPVILFEFTTAPETPELFQSD